MSHGSHGSHGNYFSHTGMPTNDAANICTKSSSVDMYLSNKKNPDSLRKESKQQVEIQKTPRNLDTVWGQAGQARQTKLNGLI